MGGGKGGGKRGVGRERKTYIAPEAGRRHDVVAAVHEGVEHVSRVVDLVDA